jgi:hypothetical protein
MTNQISDFSFIVNPEATASFHDDGIVILHAGNGGLYKSNGTGARIWRGIEQRLSLEAIADEISEEYRIARAAAREDTVRFLTALEHNALIQREALS